jgi:hypothetical protein
MLSIASGQTLFGFAGPPIVIPLAQGGKIRLLAMTGPREKFCRRLVAGPRA